MPQIPAAPPLDPEPAIASATALPDDAEVQVILFSGPDVGDLAAHRLNPTEALADDFRTIAQQYASALAQRTPVAYDVGRVPAGYELAHVAADEVPNLTEILAVVEQPVDVELFQPDSPAARALRFYIVGIHTANAGWVHFLKAKGATLRLQRTRKIAAVMRGAAYSRLEADPLIFDATFDAVIANGTVLITSQANFLRALDFVEQARELAGQTVDTLAAQLAITNLADFRATAVNDLNMVSKLRSIATKIATDPGYAAAMTTANVIAFATTNNIPIDTQDVAGETRLVFRTDPARRWRILKLLDDDYLHSQLTQFDYEVNSKSRLQ
jgi:hypothetical protein